MGLPSDLHDPDSNLWVKFETRAVQNNFRSEKEGHPCFDDMVFISIITPGSIDKVERIATSDDKRRFHRQWANFEAGNAEKVEGTPIIELTSITRAQAEELKYLGVRSIEQLANCSDVGLQKIMGGMSLREKAKAYLAVSANTAEAQKYASDNLYLKEQIEALKSQIAALGAKVGPTEAQANTKPRRGRPPKNPPQTA